MTPRDPVALRSAPRVAFFTRVMAREVRRSFEALRVARPGLPALPEGRPLIVVANHPSWWDPATCMVLAPRLFPDREGYAPIQAAQLGRYRFFARLGFFGVEDGRAGAAGFLRTSEAILADPRRMLWVTAQGRFADPRERPLGLRPGVAHLLARTPGAVALPLALEYPFWGGKRPEALALWGEPLSGAGSAAEWGERLEAGLTAACDRLRDLAVARDPAPFTALAAGRERAGGAPSLWQRARALARGGRPVPDRVAERP